MNLNPHDRDILTSPDLAPAPRHTRLTNLIRLTRHLNPESAPNPSQDNQLIQT